MHAFDLQRFDLLIFRAGLGLHLDGRIAALSEISCGNQRISRLLHRGLVRPCQDHRSLVLASRGSWAWHFGDGLLRAFDTTRATEINVCKLSEKITGPTWKRDSQGDDR